MTLEEIRAEIDTVDNAMKSLFIKRMECARHVAETKAATGGDVYVPEREREIIEHRSSDMASEIQKEYIAYLKHLMSICRRYEYGILDELQEQVVEDVLAEAGFSADMEHNKVEICFCCAYKTSNLNMFIDMARLNEVGILKLSAEKLNGKQQITMLLDGNLKDEGVRCLLCQMGKEAEDFKILDLIS